jgi:hypothetical protein
MENEDINKCNKFPLTFYFYKKGKDRWNEKYNPDEVNKYCGTEDRCCIDCYLCFTPVCFVLDIGTFFSFQCVKP